MKGHGDEAADKKLFGKMLKKAMPKKSPAKETTKRPSETNRKPKDVEKKPPVKAYTDVKPSRKSTKEYALPSIKPRKGLKT